MASSNSNSPCAACKFLRRKCTQDCVFAPYFPPDQPQKFANVHKVFGASNVTKLLNDLNPAQRADAVSSLAFEAEERLRDPVYGCVGSISILQKRLKQVQNDLNLAKEELASLVGQTPFMPEFLPTFVNADASSLMQQQLLLQKQQRLSSAPMMGIPASLPAGPSHTGLSAGAGPSHTGLSAGPSHAGTSGGQLVIKEAQEHFAALAIPDDEDSIRNWEQQQQQQQQPYLRLNVSGSGYDHATMSVGGFNQVGSAAAVDEASPSLALEVAPFDQRAYNSSYTQDEYLSKQLWQQQQKENNFRVCNYDQELQQRIFLQNQLLYRHEDDRFKFKPLQRDGGEEDSFRGPAC